MGKRLNGLDGEIANEIKSKVNDQAEERKTSIADKLEEYDDVQDELDEFDNLIESIVKAKQNSVLGDETECCLVEKAWTCTSNWIVDERGNRNFEPLQPLDHDELQLLCNSGERADNSYSTQNENASNTVSHSRQ